MNSMLPIWPRHRLRNLYRQHLHNPCSRMALVLLTLTGCNGDSSLRTDGEMLSAPIPAEIRQIAALGNMPLEIQVSVNGEVAREVPASGTEDSVGIVVNLPAEQNNEVELAWFAIINSEKLLLADFSTVITPGTTELNVANYNSNGTRFDTDGDGRSNLSEARDNRNLQSLFDVVVPRQTAFGGVFSDIIADGIDVDLSGDTVEDDRPSTFSLRHDGTNMVVYVCGRDQTLQGDNVNSDGQYWHDDTVFIFLDGADSNSPSYDGVDDFQIAFVRQTEEMIVAKGGGNQFCAAGACIPPPVFFNNSSSCEYEMEVTLPLAELNMTPGSAIGFDIEITDDDNGGLRDSSSGWIGFDDRSDLDPSTFGTITLN